jgi:hypothetical protein
MRPNWKLFWVMTCNVAMIDLQSPSPRLVVPQDRHS